VSCVIIRVVGALRGGWEVVVVSAAEPPIRSYLDQKIVSKLVGNQNSWSSGVPAVPGCMCLVIVCVGVVAVGCSLQIYLVLGAVVWDERRMLYRWEGLRTVLQQRAERNMNLKIFE